jgi:hypothetical protein
MAEDRPQRFVIAPTPPQQATAGAQMPQPEELKQPAFVRGP